MFAPKAIFLSLILLSSTAFAQQGDDAKVFYNKRIDALWTVGGHEYPGTKSHPACFANSTLEDGSGLEIVKDLESGEFYLRIQNLNWNLTEGTDDKEKLRLNLYRNGKLVGGGSLRWFILTKNTIAIPSMPDKAFLDDLWKTTLIRVIMPGDNQNFSTFIASPHIVINYMAECIEAYAPMDKPPSFDIKPDQERAKGGI
jgi:hypothetical protein